MTLRRWAVRADSRSALLAAALVVGFALPFEAIPPLISTPWFGVTDDKLILLVLVAGWLALGVGALLGRGDETLASLGERRRDASCDGPCLDFRAAAGGGGPRSGAGMGRAVVSSSTLSASAAAPSAFSAAPASASPSAPPSAPLSALSPAASPAGSPSVSSPVGGGERLTQGWLGGDWLPTLPRVRALQPERPQRARLACPWCCRRGPNGGGCCPRWCSSG